jgi:hypothetical protein
MRWEYMQVVMRRECLMEELNDRGLFGWEAFHMELDDDRGDPVVYFKRQIDAMGLPK